MSYQNALQAAGAEVLASERFGAYQGDWWSLVNWKGQTFWVHGAFGSCSVCDAFQSEFYPSEHKHPNDSYFTPAWAKLKELKPDCSDCISFLSQLKSFREGYPTNPLSQAEAEAKAAEALDWDLDAQPMLDWIKQIGAEHHVT